MLTRLTAAGLAILVAAPAFAGGNPNVRAYIDFDPPNHVHAVEPELYTEVDVYVCLDNVDLGVTSVSLRLSDIEEECPGVFSSPPQYEMLWPGNLQLYDPFSGMTIFSQECLQDVLQYPPFRLSLFYLGGSCCIRILDHPDYPRWVVDCSEPYGQLDYYCVLAHGSVGGAPCPPGDCGVVPVKNAAWGTIKSLYR
jgi:hypothetical protein